MSGDWRARYRGGHEIEGEVELDDGPWPGKRARYGTHALDPGKRAVSHDVVMPAERVSHVAIQRQQIAAARAATTDDAHRAARTGVASASAPLPFADTIQRAFGHHDVSHVATATGADAARSSEHLGASAYAYGDRIAFASAPDLHTAAHEAAHVVQQRRGVSLFSGVGTAGDAYERHADAVADAVVAGRSAESLLDAMTGGGGAGPAVQRRDKPGPKPDAEASPPLPPGVHHRLLGTDGTQVIDTAWFLDGATISGNKVRNPDKIKALAASLQPLFWWMTPEQVEASRDLPFTVSLPLPRPTFVASLLTSAFETFGLPPGTDIVWKRDDGGRATLILSIRNAGIQQPPATRASTFTIDGELRRKVDAKFAATFGFAPARPLLSQPMLPVAPSKWAWVIPFGNGEMTALAGPGWANAKEVAGADPTQQDTSVFGGITFPRSVPLADREYYLRWMEAAVGKAAPASGTGMVPVDGALIRAMRELDTNEPLKLQVVDKMRRGAGRSVLDATAFRRLVHETREEQQRIQLGIQTPPPPARDPAGRPAPKPYTQPGDVAAAPRSRIYERPITGRIVNLGSLASVDKPMDLVFQAEDPPGPGLVKVSVRWIVTPKDAPKTHAREGTTFHFAHREPAKWSVSFDKVGTYEITAIVDHQSYWPTTFKSSVEVKTSQERLSEVEQHAFDGLDANTKKEKHAFSPLGREEYRVGTVGEGELPKNYTPKDLDKRLAFMADDRDGLTRLIEVYGKRDDQVAKDTVAYAKAALDRLNASEKGVRDDAKDLVSFEIRGAFLSDKNGVRSGNLVLVGLAGRRHKTRTVLRGREDTAVVEWDQPTVRLHDMSQLYEPKNAVYTGEGTDFRASAEKAFYELCKHYPPGRLSVVMEVVTEAGRSTGKTLGFELHTGSVWKDVKEHVWDGKAQLGVNLAGAAAAIFLPGLGGVIAMGLVTAYNATDTIDNLAALEAKGQATRFGYANAFVDIGLNVLPLATQLRSVGKLGKTALFALDAAQVGQGVIVMTAEGVAQVRALRDQQVKEIAKLQDQLAELKKQKASTDAKQKELDGAIAKARDTATEVFADMALHGSVMMLTPVVFQHALNHIAGNRAKGEISVEATERRDNPGAGKLHGDGKQATADGFGVHAERADAANLLGVAPHQVVVVRDPKAKAVTVKKNADGMWEITAPEHLPHGKVLDAVWSERAKMGGAPQRPKALERGSYEPTFSFAEIVKGGRPMIVGRRIEKRAEADAILAKLAAGDAGGLADLGVTPPAKGFDPRQREWGLGVLPDGKHVIVRGERGAVDWGPFPDVRPLAHSHPLPENKMLTLDGGANSVHVLDIVKSRIDDNRNKVDFFPSVGDVAFCARNALATHSVATPYVHLGDGRIGNPVGEFADKPRVTIEIRDARRFGSFQGNDAIPAYNARVVVRDATGTLIWEGDMIAVQLGNGKNLIEFGEPPASWVKPGLPASGMGGATHTGIRAPRTKSEEKAFDDWKLLEKSGKDYGGKFESEKWYARYEDGLRYDVESQRWVRPDGRKASEPTKFEGKGWTAAKVYHHLAGPKSESTFKPFAAMLIREKIATPAQIEAMIEKHGFVGRDEDVLRHELKRAYRDTIVAKMTAPRTPEGKHAAMRRITERLAPADKGNITEVWYREAVLGGTGEMHVAARKDALAEQDIRLTKNRFVDIVDGNIGHEIKSGDVKLTEAELVQMADYARMVDGQAKVPGEAGELEIKAVRYTFTSPAGAKANAHVIRTALTAGNLRGRISFEVYTPHGKRVKIDSVAQLDAQKWMLQ